MAHVHIRETVPGEWKITAGERVRIVKSATRPSAYIGYGGRLVVGNVTTEVPPVDDEAEVAE
jgi:hypothetical protein